MSKIAIDTNILLYAIDDFYPDKQNVSLKILLEEPSICTQNISEFINVCLRKWKVPKQKVATLLTTFLTQCNYVPVSETALLNATLIMSRYDFQFFDAIVIASAIDSGCTILYSEDLSSGQLIEDRLTVINPFK